MGMITSTLVAREFVRLAETSGVSHSRLHQLCFFAHGWSAALLGEVLIDEPVEAWPYDPVFPDLYQALLPLIPYKKSCMVTRVRRSMRETVTNSFKLEPVKLSEDQLALVTLIWEEYGKLSEGHLRALLTEEGTPWERTINSTKIKRKKHRIISETMIRDYFMRKYEERRR